MRCYDGLFQVERRLPGAFSSLKYSGEKFSSMLAALVGIPNFVNAKTTTLPVSGCWIIGISSMHASFFFVNCWNIDFFQRTIRIDRVDADNIVIFTFRIFLFSIEYYWFGRFGSPRKSATVCTETREKKHREKKNRRSSRLKSGRNNNIFGFPTP